MSEISPHQSDKQTRYMNAIKANQNIEQETRFEHHFDNGADQMLMDEMQSYNQSQNPRDAKAIKGAHMAQTHNRIITMTDKRREWVAKASDSVRHNSQKKIPYLVKKNFLLMGNKEMDLKPNREAIQDACLPRFNQIRDPCQVERVDSAINLKHPSPFVDIGRLPDCKSFDMSSKARTQTIRTFLKPEIKTLNTQDDVHNVLASKLQGQLSQHGSAMISDRGETAEYMDNEMGSLMSQSRQGTHHAVKNQQFFARHVRTNKVQTAMSQSHYSHKRTATGTGGSSQNLQNNYQQFEQASVETANHNPLARHASELRSHKQILNQMGQQVPQTSYNPYERSQPQMRLRFSKSLISHRASIDDKINQIESRQLEKAKQNLLRYGNTSHKKLAKKMTRIYNYGGVRQENEFQESIYSTGQRSPGSKSPKNKTSNSIFRRSNMGDTGRAKFNSTQQSQHQSQITMDSNVTDGKSKALKGLQEQVHKRKIQRIHDESAPFIEDISQFAQRQNNIVLNALSFINEVSNTGQDQDGKVNQDLADGVDFGYKCRLDPEHLKKPEVISLLNTKIDGYMDMSIRNIIAKHEKDKGSQNRKKY